MNQMRESPEDAWHVCVSFHCLLFGLHHSAFPFDEPASGIFQFPIKTLRYMNTKMHKHSGMQNLKKSGSFINFNN